MLDPQCPSSELRSLTGAGLQLLQPPVDAGGPGTLPDSSCSRTGQCQKQERLLACFQRPTPPPCTNFAIGFRVQSLLAIVLPGLHCRLNQLLCCSFPASDTLLQSKVAAVALFFSSAGQWWPCQCWYRQGDRPQAHHGKVHCCRPPWRQDLHMDGHTNVGSVCVCGQQPVGDQGTMQFQRPRTLC